jgi:hypothetical protein
MKIVPKLLNRLYKIRYFVWCNYYAAKPELKMDYNLGVVVHTCSPSSWKDEAGGPKL